MPEKGKLTALVTGACGFIGSHMVNYLLEQGFDVTATDTVQAYSGQHVSNPASQFVAADLTDPRGLDQIFRTEFDYVFPIASIFDYTKPAQLLHKVNVEGMFNLLNAIKNSLQSPKIVIWSSGSIYGNTGLQPAYEDSPCNPKNHYERSKLEQEKLALDFAESNNLKLSVIRPAAVYGPRSKYGAAVPIIMIASGQIPFVIGPGNYIESFVHVLDVCRAAVFVASEMPETVGQAYNVCDSSRYTIEEMFLWVEKCLREVGRDDVKLLRFDGRPIHYPLWGLKPLLWWNNWRYASRRGLRPKVERDLIDYLASPFLMSNSKIRFLGFEFMYPDAKVGVKETIEWYKKEGLL